MDMHTHMAAQSSVSPGPVILKCLPKIHFLQLSSALLTEIGVYLYKSVRGEKEVEGIKIR